MPTNIALIVCDKILTEGHYIDELPFVDDVELNLSRCGSQRDNTPNSAICGKRMGRRHWHLDLSSIPTDDCFF